MPFFVWGGSAPKTMAWEFPTACLETTHGSPQDWASLALQQVDFSHGQAPGQPPNLEQGYGGMRR